MLVQKLPGVSCLVACALLGTGAVGCSNDEQARISLERALFRDVAPDEYVIAACGARAPAECTREVVIGGRVITAEVAEPQEATWRPVPELAGWVDQVTLMFEAALEESGSLRSLTFEPQWHYVSEYAVDGDPESGRRVTCFLPQRVDLQQCHPGGSSSP
jgi:hypothetical protein